MSKIFIYLFFCLHCILFLVGLIVLGKGVCAVTEVVRVFGPESSDRQINRQTESEQHKNPDIRVSTGSGQVGLCVCCVGGLRRRADITRLVET